MTKVIPMATINTERFASKISRRLATEKNEGAAMATFGIVSALGGTWRTARGGTVDGYVRADVALYPGFSGGPLVDAQGRVIGLNSWHLAGGQELAIPAASVGAIVQTLVTQGRIRRAYLGITSQPVALPESLQRTLGLSQRTGLVIVGVEAASPAEQSGLMLGDVLVSFGGQPIADPRDLQTALGSAIVDDTVTGRYAAAAHPGQHANIHHGAGRTDGSVPIEGMRPTGKIGNSRDLAQNIDPVRRSGRTGRSVANELDGAVRVGIVRVRPAVPDESRLEKRVRPEVAGQIWQGSKVVRRQGAVPEDGVLVGEYRQV